MDIVVTRQIKTGKSAIGSMFINGKFFCYTLEDTDRGLNQGDSLISIKARKLFGITAIPAGKYEVSLTYSNRFKKYMPQLLNVPGYEGVRIHTGNKPEETEGCILVGMDKAVPDAIGKSRIAFEQLMVQLQAAATTEKIYLTINRA